MFLDLFHLIYFYVFGHAMYEFFTAPGAFFGGDLPAIGTDDVLEEPDHVLRIDKRGEEELIEYHHLLLRIDIPYLGLRQIDL